MILIELGEICTPSNKIKINNIFNEVFAISSLYPRITRISLCVADLAETSIFRQEGVTTYSQLLFDVARQQVVVGARYVFSRRRLVFNY